MWSNGGYTTSTTYVTTVPSVQPIAIVPQGPLQPQFPEYYHKYLCCCGCCHVTTGTKIFGILDALLLGFSIGRFILASIYIEDYNGGHGSRTWFIVFMSIMFVWLLLAVIGIFLALCLEKAYWLIPKLAHQALVMVGTIAIIIISILYITKALSEQNRTYYEEIFFTNGKRIRVGNDGEFWTENILRRAAWSVMTMCFLSLSLELWQFTVVKACFNYLNDKAEWRESHRQPQVAYESPPAQMPLAYPPQAPMMVYGEDPAKNDLYY